MTYPAALRSRRRRCGGIGSLCMDTDQGQYIGIDDNRLAHMREVGRLCYELAADLFGWDEQRCRQMFIVGFLHDVGYEFSEKQTDHEEVGGALLADAGYAYAEPIRRHGDPEADFSDDRLLILNAADMSVSKNGQRVGFAARLADIAARYGEDSPQYENSARVIDAVSDELKRRGLATSLLG